MQSQKEGVFNAVKAVCEEHGIDMDGRIQLSTEQRKQVIDLVTKGITKGEIVFSMDAKGKYPSEDRLRSGYVPGLVSNWLRKDVRLNGGEKYQPKNPGSRAGSGDEVIRELKKLKRTLNDPEQIQAVDDEIDKRITAIRAERNRDLEIDTSLIPEELQHLVS